MESRRSSSTIVGKNTPREEVDLGQGLFEVPRREGKVLGCRGG